jgi:uncharacterized protein DUF4145
MSAPGIDAQYRTRDEKQIWDESFGGQPEGVCRLESRCLQHLLREKAKVKPQDLIKEIQEVIDRKELHSDLASLLDAVRVIGNFAAHPTKSQVTGEILDVETGEAELNLEVLERFFDHYYVQPGVIAKTKADLNVRLTAAGKPKLK